MLLELSEFYHKQQTTIQLLQQINHLRDYKNLQNRQNPHVLRIIFYRCTWATFAKLLVGKELSLPLNHESLNGYD